MCIRDRCWVCLAIRAEQIGAEQPDQEDVQDEEKVKAKGTEGYEGIFAPQNLQEQAGDNGVEEEKVEAKGTEGYQGIFAPENLQDQSGSN